VIPSPDEQRVRVRRLHAEDELLQKRHVGDRHEVQVELDREVMKPLQLCDQPTPNVRQIPRGVVVRVYDVHAAADRLELVDHVTGSPRQVSVWIERQAARTGQVERILEVVVRPHHLRPGGGVTVLVSDQDTALSRAVVTANLLNDPRHLCERLPEQDLRTHPHRVNTRAALLRVHQPGHTRDVVEVWR
jgi:hypothetical protein